jgi:hypothetical protein
MLIVQYLKQIRQTHKRFFGFVCSVLLLYALQLVLKTEITPIGYFSLYSNRTPAQSAYNQILPSSDSGKVPENIYLVNGSGFLMLEILPARYQILSASDHCNQLNHKLQRIGLYDANTGDCEALKRFHSWFRLYAERIGLKLDAAYTLQDCGFINGQLKSQKTIKTDVAE